MVSRLLQRVPVPPGPEGPARLLPALAAALDGTGPAIAPIPTVSATTSNDYVMSLLAAVRCDDGSALESDEVALVVPTSGSTGSPRGVLLTAGQATAMTSAVQGDAAPQWIAALPVTSMGGLNVLVRALATGRDPLVVPSIGGAGPFTPEAFAATVDDAVSRSSDVRTALVPAQLARLLADDAGIDALRSCASILVGGAATRGSLLSSAEDLGIAVTTTYGATETAGGCVFDGRPLPGVSVHAGPDGRLVITGPSVALGYRGEPELSAAVFAGGAFHTSDLGEVLPDGTVRVLGRADDVIIVRGVNVSPLAVEHVVSDLPDIRMAAAVAGVDAGGDPAVHAFVVVREKAPAVEDAIRQQVTERLGPHARPIVHRVDRLPHLPNGKVDRRTLQTQAGKGTD